MAYSVSTLRKTVFGTQRVSILSCVADAASGAIDTGLKKVLAAHVQFVSCATAGFKVKNNLSAASAAAGGSVFVSSAASGDVFIMTAIGI